MRIFGIQGAIVSTKPPTNDEFSAILSGTTDTPRPGLATMGYELLGARLNELQHLSCNVNVIAIAEYREHWQAVADGRAQPLNPDAVANSYGVTLKEYAEFLVRTCEATEVFVRAMQALQTEFGHLKRSYATSDGLFESLFGDDAQA